MFKIPGSKAHAAIGAVTIGISSLGNTSGTSGPVLGPSAQVILAGGNNVTLSQSVVRNSATITISAQSQSNQSFGFYLTGNTTGESSSSTINPVGITLHGEGAASVGYSGGSIIIDSPAGGAGSAGTMTLGMSNIGNTSGTTGTIAANPELLVFVGGNNITLSQSVSNSSATVTISANDNKTLSVYALSTTFGESSSTTLDIRSVSIVGMGNVSVGLSAGSFLVSHTTSDSVINWFSPMNPRVILNRNMLNSTLEFQPYTIPNNITFCRAEFLHTVQMSNLTARSNTTGGYTNSMGWSSSIGLYSFGTGASSESLYSVTSASGSNLWVLSVSVSSGGATTVTASVSGAFVCYTSIDTNGNATTTSLTSSSSRSAGASSVTLSNPLLSLSGAGGARVIFRIPFGGTLSAGNYVLGYLALSSSTSSNQSLTFITVSGPVGTSYSRTNLFGQSATAASMVMVPGTGHYSASTTQLPASFGLTDINFVPNVNFIVLQSIALPY